MLLTLFGIRPVLLAWEINKNLVGLYTFPAVFNLDGKPKQLN